VRKFFRGLFDTSFDFFISPSIAGFLYGIAVIASFATMALATVTAFITETFNLLLLVPGAFLALIVIRATFETSIALIKIAENTKPEE
jgi:hypothetical protein